MAVFFSVAPGPPPSCRRAPNLAPAGGKLLKLNETVGFRHVQLRATSCNFVQLRATSCDFVQLRATSCNAEKPPPGCRKPSRMWFRKSGRMILRRGSPCTNFVQLRVTSCNFVQLRATSCNFMQLRATSCNFVQTFWCSLFAVFGNQEPKPGRWPPFCLETCDLGRLGWVAEMRAPISQTIPETIHRVTGPGGRFLRG